MATYKLTSTKGTRTIEGTQDEAIAAAKVMQEELQAAFGVSVEDENGHTVAEIDDARDAICHPFVNNGKTSPPNWQR